EGLKMAEGLPRGFLEQGKAASFLLRARKDRQDGLSSGDSRARKRQICQLRETLWIRREQGDKAGGSAQRSGRKNDRFSKEPRGTGRPLHRGIAPLDARLSVKS